jgi:hypothetical protein
MAYKQKNYKTVYDFYTFEKENNEKLKENLLLNINVNNYNSKYNLEYEKEEDILPDKKINKVNDSVLELKWETIEGTGSSPHIFGPPLWFTLHNSSNNYPDNPSPIVKERMKNIIIGIPVLLPCANCKDHATAYIETHFDKLDDIVSTRDKLFNFFVDFHNYVNKRYNKKTYSYEEAKDLYSGKNKVSKLSYK